MKTLFVLLPVAAALAACSSTPQYNRAAEDAAQQRVEIQKTSVKKAPDWFVKVPVSTSEVRYSTGTFSSFSWELADRTATDLALGKLCTSIGGRIDQQSKVYQRESGGDVTEFSETAIKNVCPQVDVSGFTVEAKDQYTEANGKIRVYVLVAYRVGAKPANQTDMDRVFSELEAETAPKKIIVKDKSGESAEVEMIDLTNKDVEARRMATLKKPNAVYGRTEIGF